MPDIIVIGGGISGLATAWFLKSHGRDVRVLEAGAEPGGCLKTVSDNSFLVDTGPTSTLFKEGALGELIRNVGLSDDLIEANKVARNRYIVKNGKLVPLPMGPGAFLGTSLFSGKAKLRVFLEPFKGRAAAEETVAQFVTRRLGPEFLDWAIDPFVSGVYAGDPDKLSAWAATAKVYALEAESGSLFIGALARAFRGKASGPQPRGKLISFLPGMQALPAGVAEDLHGLVTLDAEVVEIEPRVNGGWTVRTDQQEYEASEIVLSTPAYHAARLLAPLDSDLGRELQSIRYPPVASIALGFRRDQVADPLNGFGILIPSKAGYVTLGALFSSTLFPGRSSDDDVLLTAFIGGARNEEIADQRDEELVGQVLADIGPLLKIRGEPHYQRVTVWPRAIPQYEMGHLQRVSRIDAALAKLPGLHVRANWRDGISVSDCVENAKKLAAKIEEAGERP